MKVKVQRYDYTVKRPPYTHIDIGEFEVSDSLEPNQLVKEFYRKCNKMKMTFRFYTSAPDLPEYEYIVTAVPDDMRYEEDLFNQRSYILQWDPNITDEELDEMKSIFDRPA